MAAQPFDSLPTVIKETPVFSGRQDSIKITRRTESSFYTRVIQFITRQIRGHLAQPPKEGHPEGSIKLTPKKIIFRTCTYTERQVVGIYLYEIIPISTHGKEIQKRIYYFCGGGWQSLPSGQHWQVCSKIARSTENTSISIVSYPLAPNNPAPSSFPKLMRLYRELIREAEEEGVKVILAGDSSGANIVLSLVLEALREDSEAKSSESERHRVPHPVAVMVISPSTDLTRSNPDIEKLKSVDPLLTPDFVKQTAAVWKGDWDATDRRISPINADISLLAKRGIRVHGVTGGYDILSPDSIVFRDKLAKEGVKGEWLQWDRQMHCFVLTWPYGIPEGREGTGWIIDILKKE